MSDRERVIIEGKTPQQYRIICDGVPMGSFATATEARDAYGSQRRMCPGADITILDGHREITIQQLRKIADSENF